MLAISRWSTTIFTTLCVPQAFIYYDDPSVVNTLGERVMRSAVLVRENWLITSALEASADNADGFPEKTLLARVGAINIDGNFTLSEDEDEQEREVSGDFEAGIGVDIQHCTKTERNNKQVN